MNKKLQRQLELLEDLESIIKIVKAKQEEEVIEKSSMLDVSMPKEVVESVFKIRKWLREQKIRKVRILGLDWTIDVN